MTCKLSELVQLNSISHIDIIKPLRYFLIMNFFLLRRMVVQSINSEGNVGIEKLFICYIFLILLSCD